MAGLALLTISPAKLWDWNKEVMETRQLQIGGMVPKTALFGSSKLLDQHHSINHHPQVRDFYLQMTFSGPNKIGVTTNHHHTANKVLKKNKKKGKKAVKGIVTAGELLGA